jgi:hypothetical protein
VTAQREIISAEQAEKLVAACRAAGAGDDYVAVQIILALLRFFARQNDSMRVAVALELIRAAMQLDPDCEHVRWN